jgi:glutamate 5-kinase
MNRAKYTQQSQRWIVKIGSALLTQDGKGLDYASIADWASQIAKLRLEGIEVVLVSSGSIAEGMSRMGWAKRPTTLPELQAAAAIGQTGLIQAYQTEFQKYQIQAAQILLTHDDVSHRLRYLNARNTLRTLIRLGTVPIINENDTVAFEEIRLSDNDTLGAIVSSLVEADLLVILTDQKGLFNKDPRYNDDAEFISEGLAMNPDYVSYAGAAGSAISRGGMATKVQAARVAAKAGCATVIVSGREDNVLTRLREGEAIGTLLVPEDTKLAARKLWIAGQSQAKGTLYVDAGAAAALTKFGKSLLPVGVERCTGKFKRGDRVNCIDPHGKVIAKGLCNYSNLDVAKICKLPSDSIPSVLGYMDEEELIHRDNLVLED